MPDITPDHPEMYWAAGYRAAIADIQGLANSRAMMTAKLAILLQDLTLDVDAIGREAAAHARRTARRTGVQKRTRL